MTGARVQLQDELVWLAELASRLVQVPDDTVFLSCHSNN